MNEPEPNASASVTWTIRASDLANVISADPTDRFPAVFATSRLITLCEVAAARALTPILQEGELSVGVAIEIVHSAPTPEGAWVTATARYNGREDKLFLFDVVAHDPGGEIGRGTHKRAVVSEERLLAGAHRRAS